MRAVIFYMATIIEIAYVFMSQVPKKLENKYLLIGTAFICASDFTYHIGYNAINMSVFALSGTIAKKQRQHSFCMQLRHTVRLEP